MQSLQSRCQLLEKLLREKEFEHTRRLSGNVMELVQEDSAGSINMQSSLGPKRKELYFSDYADSEPNHKFRVSKLPQTQ